ncbi:hypothetical protein TRIUR3_32675 [Triticum urartu]|uniref:Uncharacterized protein n=1 Tax=Triticum urartu TaxID=4572 RepID=M8AHU3_TRIUA|nr:hypothetical protein TRIUR3_32675 [Triticum urartu]
MKQPQTEATEAETHEDSEAVVPRQQVVDGGAAPEEQQRDGVATLALSMEQGRRSSWRLEVPWTSGARGGAGKGGRAGDVLVQQRPSQGRTRRRFGAGEIGRPRQRNRSPATRCSSGSGHGGRRR